VRVFWLSPQTLPHRNRRRIVLNFHGGAYVYAPGRSGLEDAVLVARAGFRVVCPDYRMAPDHPYPAAIDDAEAVWRHLAKDNPPNRIAVCGTSTGGGMTLALIHRLKARKLPLPGAIWAGTPWSDLTKTGDSYWTNELVDKALVVFSQGISPNAKTALGRHAAFSHTILFTATTAPAARSAGKLDQADLLYDLLDGGGDLIVFPLAEEYTTLIRFVGPLCGYLSCLQFAAQLSGCRFFPPSPSEILPLLDMAPPPDLLEAVLDDEDIARRYRRAPAAKHIHHAFLGGLIEHVLSVCAMARLTAGHYSYIDGDLLLTGVILHDIGKMAIPDAILRKPYPLNADEKNVVQEHSYLGYRMLKKIPFLAEAADIVAETAKRAIIERLAKSVSKTFTTGSSVGQIEKILSAQQRIVLGNAGEIDPENINEYIASNGYAALAKALAMKPDDVIAEVKISELRGRGGAGFPTATKWTSVAQEQADIKYLVCNADEGEPGTFKDREIMEGDPHKLIEGMIIAGYAVGASQGYIYVRGEYFLSIGRLEKAVADARVNGLLGGDILGFGFAFDIEVLRGAGAYVCGEESALIESIEGKRGEPRRKPPYPAQKGLWQKPTMVNNVETLAIIPHIVQNGGEWFKALGVEGSRGTKLFSLSGDINWKGVVELPFGVPPRVVMRRRAVDQRGAARGRVDRERRALAILQRLVHAAVADGARFRHS